MISQNQAFFHCVFLFGVFLYSYLPIYFEFPYENEKPCLWSMVKSIISMWDVVSGLVSCRSDCVQRRLQWRLHGFWLAR